MGWPWQFLDLSDAEKHQRRLALDRYAGCAQLSALLPVAAGLAWRLAAWALARVGAARARYDAVPDSPALKTRRRSAAGTWAARLRVLRWWLEDDVVAFGRTWGKRDDWIVGAAWAAWLLVLCVAGTGKDYLHLTKRFGIVAASQFPVQYLLSLRLVNPVALAFRSSHEQVNRWHRALGRIIYGLLVLHAALYLNYFVQAGILRRRLLSPVVALGVLALAGMTLLYATALGAVRRWSYRVFFVVHVLVAVALPPLVFLHARSADVYVVEALLAFVADLVARKLGTVTARAAVEPVPGTSLVKVSAALPPGKAGRFRERPGAHVYLSLPAAARLPPPGPAAPGLLFAFLYNPFTVAAVDDATGTLTLVARQRGGPLTAALARLAAAQPATAPPGATTTRGAGGIPLGIEGPYGAADRLPRLSGGGYDRVLLVAGGVGATFTVPLYRALLADNPGARVEMVWAVRGAGDATWAVAGPEGRPILDDDNVHIFLTGDNPGSPEPPAASGGGGGVAGDGDGGVEMSSLDRDPRRGGRPTAQQHGRRRPDFRKIVDDAFRHGSEERVAVLVCGPEEMGRQVREHVGAWVRKGRTVFWHNEAFGW